jgi:hypothetical protein
MKLAHRNAAAGQNGVSWDKIHLVETVFDLS